MHHLDGSSVSSSRDPACPVSPGAEQGGNGQPLWVSRESLEPTSTCVLHSHPALCMEIVIISLVMVCLIVTVVLVNG